MYTEKIQDRKLIEKDIDHEKTEKVCHVSKASNDLMIARFSNGDEIGFPFTE